MSLTPHPSVRDPVKLRFGEYELDVRNGELRRNGSRLPLQEQPLQLLIALTATPGTVVTRDELRARLWPEQIFVDFEHGLNTAVRRLREALGDVADAPRFIETVPRRGYRFVAAVERLPEVDAPARPRVAVLPFLNLTPDAADGYFADGITEDLITELSRLPALRVVSRTSVMRFRQRDQDLREIVDALRVNMVVEGSVRQTGNRVRIAVRLVDAARDAQVWAETFDRELTDIFAIQKEVALQVAGAMVPEASLPGREAVGRSATSDLEAYHLYLHGRHCVFQFTEQSIRQGIEYFERAAERAPKYSLAYAGLGFAYMVLGTGHGAGSMPQPDARARARQAIDRALVIDPALGQAHSVDACLKFMVDFDWPGAERAFRKAIELGPESAETFDTYGLFLSSLERYDEALAAQHHAHDLDPLAPFVMSDIATTLLRAGRYDEAEEQARRLARLTPTFPMAHSTLGWALINKGLIQEGLAALDRAVAMSPDNTLLVCQLGQAAALTGDRERANSVLRQVIALAQCRYVSPYHLAYIYTGLGDDERAIDYLEAGVEQRAGGVYGVRGSFLFRSLRGHPRFLKLLARMNLLGGTGLTAVERPDARPVAPRG